MCFLCFIERVWFLHHYPQGSIFANCLHWECMLHVIALRHHDLSADQPQSVHSPVFSIASTRLPPLQPLPFPSESGELWSGFEHPEDQLAGMDTSGSLWPSTSLFSSTHQPHRIVLSIKWNQGWSGDQGLVNMVLIHPDPPSVYTLSLGGDSLHLSVPSGVASGCPYPVINEAL